jgi:hypothetical protein
LRSPQASCLVRKDAVNTSGGHERRRTRILHNII